VITSRRGEDSSGPKRQDFGDPEENIVGPPRRYTPPVGRLFALAAAAILLLTVGAILIVNRLTEYQPAQRTAGERASDRAAAAAPDLPVYAQPPADYSQQGPGEPIVIPAGPMTGGAVQNESPPIQGPTAVPLPEDPAARGAAISTIRSDKVNEQMERINRRNRERLGLKPGDDVPDPPTRQP
jgi:hypothetical protein